MRNKLLGKRLLVLGGSQWKEAIKSFAKEFGVSIIATGNNMSAGIFSIADEGYNINSTDAESMKKLILEKHIDGVYMGGSEPVIASACKYLHELGYPCYCTENQWESLQNKEKFKQLCINFDLPVAQQYKMSFDDINNKKIKIEFPVITKPTDGCGSSGFSVCHDWNELSKGYKIAAENSYTGSVVVEKFVKNEGMVVFYSFSEGKLHFAGLEDKYPVRYKKQGSYVGGLFIYESRFTNEFREKFENKLQLLFNSLEIKEGSIWIEVFHDGDNYYFNEVGFRYGGSISVYPVDYLFGINQVYADMYYALTGESRLYDFTPLNKLDKKKKHYAIYPIYVRAGIITEFIGESDLLKVENIVKVFVTKNVNEEVLSSGSFGQSVALVHFVFDSLEECKNTLDIIHNTFKVLDNNKDNMIDRMYKWEEHTIIL